jgi:hypothetical protein
MSDDLARFRQAAAELRSRQEAVQRDVAAQSAALREAEARLAHARQLGDRAAADAAAREGEGIRTRIGEMLGDRTRFESDLRDRLGELGAIFDPCDTDPAIPLLLLPVRIETRYTGDGTKLRVRIYPDDIHLDTLERGLTAEEATAGRAWWSGAWRASGEPELEVAWRTLIAAVGRFRAGWVAEATRPRNLAARGTDPAPDFPEATQPARARAVARLLPDRFNVAAVLRSGEVRRGTGRQVPPALPVGILAGEGSRIVEVAGLRLAEGAEWIADYAAAEALGMAVTLDLGAASAEVAELHVFGVRQSLDPEATAAELEALLAAHRFGNGFAILSQGTPTNNTEAIRTEWQRRPEPVRPSPDPLPAAGAGANIAVLAGALGLDPARLDATGSAAGAQEQSRAGAMNVALWGASWGAFLDKINSVGRNGAAIPQETWENAREFHRDHVRGRGPLPAIRIGQQPYGILPVSAVQARWAPAPGDAFEAGLLDLLRRAWLWWRIGIDNVPRIGGGPVAEVLPAILGATPVCHSVRARPILSDTITEFGIEAAGGSFEDLRLERMLEAVVATDVLRNASSGFMIGALTSDPRLIPLPLVHESDPAAIATIVAGGDPAPASVLQALLVLSWDRAEREVKLAAPSAEGVAALATEAKIPASLRERLVLLAASDRPEPAALGETLREVRAFSGFAAAPTPIEFEPVEAFSRGGFRLATEAKLDRERTAKVALAFWNAGARRRAELRRAMEEIATTTTEERRILVAETLDTASHRLDAWITALVERRRRAQRAARPQGLTIGAYGWVEALGPRSGREAPGGFIHAPSLAQAATAGVLRSAHRTHGAAAGGGGAFAVDLSSARVRRALELLDGIRQGQPLGALLGYRIERALHERGADRLILSLRAVAPLVQGRLTDRGEEVPRPAQEAIAAANVVDGVLLVERYNGPAPWGRQAVEDRLALKPEGNAYVTGEWQPPSRAELDAVKAAVEEAEAALDAVGDLLLAESVHQLVQGNVARAAAALDAAGTGEAPPPVPQVVATPAEGLPVAHRLMAAVLHPPPPAAPGWDGTRPRAAAEPSLEAWAEARLGDPAQIVVTADADGAPVTLDRAKLCALDLVLEAGDRTGFDARLRAALPDLPAGTTLAEAPEPGWAPGLRAIGEVHALAAALRALLAGAQPARPEDLALPGAKPTRAEDPADLAAAASRLAAAADLMELRATALEGWLRSSTDAVAQRAALESLAAFGVLPPVATAAGDQVALGELALDEAARRLSLARAALARPVTADTLAEAGTALFGDAFRVTVPLAPSGPDPWDVALHAPPPGASRAAIRRILADAGSVRDGARRLGEALLLAGAVGEAPVLRAMQLAGAGDLPPERWIALPLPEGAPTPDTPVASFLLDLLGEPAAGRAVSALVFDQWVETLPVRTRQGEPKEGVPPPAARARVTTGVAFHAAAPSARAPQSLLLAVPPDPAQRWNSDTLLAVLRETLELARLRGVTMEHTVGATRLLPALYTRSWSLQGEKALNFSEFASEFLADRLALYVREPGA